MTKRVLSVGQCDPDDLAIRRLLAAHFDVRVDAADGPADALAALAAGPYDLVLVNRKLDVDYSDGVEVVRRIKSDPALAATPVMLITNLAEHQEAAVTAGAARGFGKLEYGAPATRERLAEFLG